MKAYLNYYMLSRVIMITECVDVNTSGWGQRNHMSRLNTVNNYIILREKLKEKKYFLDALTSHLTVYYLP